MILNPGSRIALAVCVGTLLLFAAWSSIRLSYADWLFSRNTSESVSRALSLDPQNGRYYAWLAELQENQGQDATATLDAAARLNPLDSRAWIRRGLAAELNGNRPEAERLLLHAASIDKLLEPRWALMNFYFRAGDEANFWRWAKAAFPMSYGDRTPLFDLCWKMREDAPLIASRALPDDYAISLQFMNFLLAKGQSAQAALIAERILARAPAEDTPVFTACVEKLISRGDTRSGVQVWNALCARRLLPFERLDPARGASLTNGGFERFPTGIGFDWRISHSPEVTAVKTPEGLRLSLSGKQDDVSDVLEQTLPLQSSQRYRLRFSYLTSGIEGSSGIRLRVLDQSTPGLSSGQWREQTLAFTNGPGTSAALIIEYRRQLGTMRAEGTLELRRFVLELAE